MRVLTHKLAPLFVALCALAANVVAQEERAYAEAPNLKLTLTAGKTAWKPNEAAPVRVRIENATGDRIEIPSSISFAADNRFWSPVSLTKTYASRPTVCQNDLLAERVENVKSKVIVIHPDRGELILEKGEAREFSFDLSGMCWGHSMSAFYPGSTIFENARGFQSNSYRVYFKMRFPMLSSRPGDRRFHQLKSNAVEVTIN